jgi:hypothetical protein
MVGNHKVKLSVMLKRHRQWGWKPKEIAVEGMRRIGSLDPLAQPFEGRVTSIETPDSAF